MKKSSLLGNGSMLDLTLGPSDFMKSLKSRHPWLNDYQAAQATNLILQEAAELISRGGILGVLIPGNPSQFIALDIVPTNPNDIKEQ